ncbi:MAG TPA: YkgJ family cysteine cluster protein [Thermoleophilia bacterium]|nr:YkgJ family cysteine cluster protein [Thermoleophilia bacterium]
MDHDGEIATERFSAWLRRTRRALRTGEAVAVPCGDCTACCTSSYFVHIDADEGAALAAVPDELKFAAPGRSPGGVVLGYDRRGHCPLFDGRGCAIYERRPRTCRTYDCRIFPATGLTVGSERPAIARGAARFWFDLSGARDRADLAAVRAAARFLTEHTAAFPAGFVPENPTQQAVVAVKVYEVFRDAARATPGAVEEAAPPPEAVEATVSATVAAFARFEAGKTPA